MLQQRFHDGLWLTQSIQRFTTPFPILGPNYKSTTFMGLGWTLKEMFCPGKGNFHRTLNKKLFCPQFFYSKLKTFQGFIPGHRKIITQDAKMLPVRVCVCVFDMLLLFHSCRLSPCKGAVDVLAAVRAGHCGLSCCLQSRG